MVKVWEKPSYGHGSIAHWGGYEVHSPPQVKNRYYKKPLFVTIMNQNLWGNINLDIFVHCDVCRLKNGNFKNIKIVENHKKKFSLIHITFQGMFK